MAENKETKLTIKNEETVVETVEEVVEQKVIETPKPVRDTPTLGFNSDGVMGSTSTNPNKDKVENVVSTDGPVTTKIALFSTRNMYAEGAGKLNVGYNIVPKKFSEFWLGQRGVRLATPEEVAEAFR